jgi:hypothetical protein
MLELHVLLPYAYPLPPGFWTLAGALALIVSSSALPLVGEAFLPVAKAALASFIFFADINFINRTSARAALKTVFSLRKPTDLRALLHRRVKITHSIGKKTVIRSGKYSSKKVVKGVGPKNKVYTSLAGERPTASVARAYQAAAGGVGMPS